MHCLSMLQSGRGIVLQVVKRRIAAKERVGGKFVENSGES